MTMKPKHTPGPWTAVTDGDTHPSVIGPDGKSIFSTANARSRLYAENCANVILGAKVFEYQDLLVEAVIKLEAHDHPPINLIKRIHAAFGEK